VSSLATPAVLMGLMSLLYTNQLWQDSELLNEPTYLRGGSYSTRAVNETIIGPYRANKRAKSGEAREKFLAILGCTGAFRKTHVIFNHFQKFQNELTLSVVLNLYF